jgi:hypothetical protein
MWVLSSKGVLNADYDFDEFISWLEIYILNLNLPNSFKLND